MKIRTEKLTIAYGKKIVIKNVDIKIQKGEMVTIIGANGSGKTTILKTISRSLKPIEGNVYLDEKEIFKYDTRKLACKLAILPQIHNVPEDFSVSDLVSFGRFPHLGLSGRLTFKDFYAIDRAIELANIEELQHRRVSTLSGGERQRAWIAMALAQQPEVLLLDEPTTFLDINHQFELLEMISDLNKNMGITIVMVLHDLNQAARYSQRLLVLREGRIFKEGPPGEIITEEVLESVFNIKVRIINDREYNCPYFIPKKSIKESVYEYNT